MFIEISMMQGFILFLGQPFYSVSVILASLLISSGVGSLFSGRLGSNTLVRILSIIPILLLSYLFLLPYVFNIFLGNDLFIRALISFLLLFPAGFILGMPFPFGIRIAGEIDGRLVPWGWCSNLSSSVLSSILAAIIALYCGFTSVVVIAAIAYLLCFLIIIRNFS